MTRRAKRLLFLFSDTGGGHRSTAYAVAQALRDLYEEQAHIELVDALAEYAPWPFRRLDSLYPYLVRLRGSVWAAGYHLSDGPRQATLLTRGCWPLVRPAFLHLFREHPADVIVCCHPLFNDIVLRTLTSAKRSQPLITLVTDLATAHAFWFVPGVTRCLVPTEEVRRCGLDRGMPAERLLVTGLPVDRRFVTTAQEDPLAVRQKLGLDPDLPMVLLVNGAEGMGPLHQLYRAVADSGVHAQLVIIAGRNKQAQAKLSIERSPVPVHVKGFVNNMHEWMRAADLLVTKAGPSTISEALVMGLPMVLSGALPGQERPNADYVVRTGAGVWAPTPREAATAVKELLRPDNHRLAKMAVQAQALAQPHAGRRVAEIVWAIADQGTTHQPTQSIN